MLHELFFGNHSLWWDVLFSLDAGKMSLILCQTDMPGFVSEWGSGSRKMVGEENRRGRREICGWYAK